MAWMPDPSLQWPIYVQIADHFHSRMRTGEYPAGTRLPSERELAERLGVNRSTVVAAYDRLASYGLVDRVKGYGTVAKDRTAGESDSLRVPNWEKYVKDGYLHANDPITRRIHAVLGSNKPYINFAIGELSPDLFPMEWLKEAHAGLDLSRYLGYEPVQGNARLRETIADHLAKYRGIECSPSSLLVTSGAQQAIQLIVQGLLKPGDAVAIEDPSYSFSMPIFRSAGLRTYRLPVEDDGIDPEALVRLHKAHRVKTAFLNPLHHNPTGTTMSMARRKRLLEASSEYGIAIVEDDPYSLTGFDGERELTLKSMDENGSVLYVSSLSKIVSSGLRVGWIAGPQAIIDRLADAKQQLDFGLSSLPQWVAAELLASPELERQLERLRSGLRDKLFRTAEALRMELGDAVRFRLPRGGVHLWCELAGAWDEAELFDRAIANGVVVTPGSTLGSSDRHVRFTYSRADDSAIADGVARFAEAYRESLRVSLS